VWLTCLRRSLRSKRLIRASQLGLPRLTRNTEEYKNAYAHSGSPQVLFEEFLSRIIFHSSRRIIHSYRMPQFTQSIVSLKKAVRRGITKRSNAKLPKVERSVACKGDLSSAPWVVVDGPSQEAAAHGASSPFNGSSDSLPSSAPSSIFSQGNSSTSSIRTVVSSDDGAEKAGRRPSDISESWEYIETEVRQRSESYTNSMASRADPMGSQPSDASFVMVGGQPKVHPTVTAKHWSSVDVCSLCFT